MTTSAPNWLARLIGAVMARAVTVAGRIRFRGRAATNAKRERSSGHPERRSALGKHKHVPGSSEDFARRKQEEIEREDGGWIPPAGRSGEAE
jgi:hypothetical protein